MTDCSDPRCAVCRTPASEDDKDGVWVCSTCYDMPDSIDGYIDRVNRALRGSITTRRRLLEEVRLHLEDLANDESDATDRADCERRAVRQMGSPERLAAEIPHRRWHPWIIVASTIVFALGGLAYSQHQQKLYAATSDVIHTSTSGRGPITERWGAQQVAIAESTDLARMVVVWAGPRLAAPRTPESILSETTITSTADRNGLRFTVTDSNALAAKLIADGFATQYPRYLRELDPNSTVNRLSSQIARVELMIAHPAIYSKASGHTLTERVATWMFDLVRLRHSLGARMSVDPGFEESTVSRLAANATVTQPQSLHTIALAALIGLIVGLILTVGLYVFDILRPSSPTALAG